MEDNDPESFYRQPTILRNTEVDGNEDVYFGND